MKSIILFICFISCFSVIGYAQSKKELQSANSSLKIELQKKETQIDELQKKVQNLQLRILILEDSLAKQRNTPASNRDCISSHIETMQRCKAITTSGKQCSRNAQSGSDYCGQHQKKVGNDEVKPSSYSTTEGRTIYTGPRGGKYYINSKGKKTYLKRK